MRQPVAEQGRGDRRRRLQRGGLPRPADRPRGARLAAHRLAPVARAEGARCCGGWPQPAISARVRDIDEADAILVLGTDPLHSSPILDLRIRKAIRRNGAKLVVATERPTALDGGAEAIARYAPGQAAHFVSELASAIGGERERRHARSPRPCATPARSSSSGASGSPASDGAAEALLEVAEGDWHGRAPTAPACSKSPTPPTPAACARRAASPTPARASAETAAGKSTEEIRSALISGELTGLILFGVDPLRDFPDTPAWEEALTAADFVVCFSMHENATTAKADVVFPLETHAEKDGTVTHPDGRLQRVRPSASRPGDIRPNFIVLSELAANLGLTTGIDSQPTAFAALTDAVTFYTGIEDSDIGGRGIRWQDKLRSIWGDVPEVDRTRRG